MIGILKNVSRKFSIAVLFVLAGIVFSPAAGADEVTDFRRAWSGAGKDHVAQLVALEIVERTEDKGGRTRADEVYRNYRGAAGSP